MTFEERKQAIIAEGIVPGVVICCAVMGPSNHLGDYGIVADFEEWKDLSDAVVCGIDRDGHQLFAYSSKYDRYATVITPAEPSEVDRLRERVKELEGALEGIMELRYSSRIGQAIEEAEAILNKSTNAPDQQ
jgi:hypothetical protein